MRSRGCPRKQGTAVSADLDVAREVIYAVGLKVLPDFQEFKAAVVEHLVLRKLQNLGEEHRAVALADLIAYQPAATPRLQRGDVLRALNGLRKRALVTVTAPPGGTAFLLTGLGASHLAREGSAFVKELNEVCSGLFGDVEDGERSWSKAFARLLCGLFAALGHEYVSVLTTRRRLGDVLAPAALLTFAEKARHELPAVDAARLAEKTGEFLRDSGPAATSVKWILAQGHFALKVLGVGKGAEALASAVLGGKSLYLDTNIFFSALAVGMPHEHAIGLLSQMCAARGATLLAARPTIDEFARSLRRQIDDARHVADKVPQELSRSVSDAVYCVLLQRRQENPHVPVDVVLSELEDAFEALRKRLRLRVADDRWFAEAASSQDVERLSKSIADTYLRMRNRRKTRAAAQHDAIMLLFIARERSSGRDGLLITLDTSLPFCDVLGSAPLAVTLDAFLQWCGAGGSSAAQAGDLADIFSTALAERFIPTGRHLQLAQFRLLDEFGVQCEQLPPEDIRSCIERLNRVLLRADPSTADGREVIQREIRVFLAAPERRYAETLGGERGLRKAAEARVEILEKRLRLIGKVCLTRL
jgi:predicted nucleic acid-binding protein